MHQQKYFIISIIWYFQQFVHNLIDMEISTGTPIDKIILAGHSQGGALALYASLTYKPRKETWSTIDMKRWVDLVRPNEKYTITDKICLDI